MYNELSQSRFKTSVLRSSLYDYSDVYVLVKGTLTVENKPTQCQQNNVANKKVILKSCAPFTNCVSRIINAQVDHAHDIDIVMSMYKLIVYSNNFSKISGILRQYCRDDLAVDGNNEIVDFTEANAITDPFKRKEKMTDKT